jgi:hypothetical protein
LHPVIPGLLAGYGVSDDVMRSLYPGLRRTVNGKIQDYRAAWYSALNVGALAAADMADINPAELEVQWNLLKGLLAVQGQTGDESRVMDFIETKLKEMNIIAKVGRDASGNLYVEIAATAGGTSLPTVLFLNHADVVEEVDGIVKPEMDAFGKIRNLNADSALGSDNRAGLAQALSIIQKLSADFTDHGKIKMLVTVKEEVAEGIRGIYNKDFLSDVDYVISGDRQASTLEERGARSVRGTVFTDGSLPLHIEVFGKQNLPHQIARLLAIQAQSFARAAFKKSNLAKEDLDFTIFDGMTTGKNGEANTYEDAYYLINFPEASNVRAVFNIYDGGTYAHQRGFEALDIADHMRMREVGLNLVEQIYSESPSFVGKKAVEIQPEPRTELKAEEPVAPALAPVERTAEGVLARAMEVSGAPLPQGVGNIRLASSIADSPTYDPLLSGKAGYFNEATMEIAINRDQLDEDLATLDSLAALEQEVALAQMVNDLAVVLEHEKVHVASGDELAAYDATVAIMKRLDAARYADQIDLINTLLATARGNVSGRSELRQDIAQIALAILNSTTNAATGIETLLSRVQSEVISIGNPEFAALGATSIKPEELAGSLDKYLNATADTEHKVFLVSEESAATPELRRSLEALQKRGYGIFVYGKEGIQEIFTVTVFASWLGVGQFETLMNEHYGVRGRNAQGYLAVNAFLSNELIKVLLTEILSVQQVAAAA